MYKYLIILRGKKDCGKTSTLKKLSKILIHKYKFISYLISNCEYVKKEWQKIEDNDDIFVDGEIGNKKIIISSGGDYLKCIENFLEKFSKDNIFIGIIACQCVNINNKKFQKINEKIKKQNIILIETTTYSIINLRYATQEMINKMNHIKADELYNLIKKIVSEYK